ncbi:MAG: oligoribonuclease [Candidatus Omnitrophica bacterium]|nr:oligoribonuclease [Candidatus Omnitrophota bacterium]
MTDTAKKAPPRLVWIDMEMTGLNPKKEVIIEIATIITDQHLKVIEEGPDIIVHQAGKYLDGMDDWNMKHHLKSGLFKGVVQSKISTKQAEALTLDFIKKYCAEKKAMLCGNSIHHDRRFLERYMPRIHEYLHYRHVDVSSVKSLVNFWYKKNRNPFSKTNKHRALDDIRESIEELRFYKKHFFKKSIRTKVLV